jgi:multiple sugar transport system permease protein
MGVLRGGWVQVATVAVRPELDKVSRREIRPRPVPPHIRRRRFLMSVGDHAVLITVSAIFFMPIVFIVLTALMTDHQSLTPHVWPTPFRWSNFADVFRSIPLLRYTWNTTVYATLSTLGVVVSSIPVAYALSRMRWRGRQVAFVVILATLMLPFQVTVVPLYIIFVRLHWIGSLKPLIIPAFFGDAFSIFLLRQFFLTIPEELSDAARVDGGGEFQIMTRVIVPLAKPAIAAVALFNFLYAWNDLFGPLLFAGESQQHWTLTIGLSQFKALHHVQWNLTMAASILFMLPVIILFFLAQRVFIEGITLTGVKG